MKSETCTCSMSTYEIFRGSDVLCKSLRDLSPNSKIDRVPRTLEHNHFEYDYLLEMVRSPEQGVMIFTYPVIYRNHLNHHNKSI